LSKETEALEQVHKMLGDKVDIKTLAVLGLGPAEQIIGEIIGEPSSLVIGSVKVKDPKRYLRIQQMTQEGLSISFMIGDLDMMDSGTVEARPNWGYYVKDMGTRGQTDLLRLYVDFLERRSVNRAKEAGLHLPTRGLLK
jgi:hypothetical protein